LKTLAAALVALMAATAWAPAAEPLTPEQANLAYCHAVLTSKQFGGLRPDEDDPGTAKVLLDRLAKRLERPEDEIARTVLPEAGARVVADMIARGRPRYSPTACAGYAHFIRTTPDPRPAGR
jgi:hypothetical protein